jgi:hypothetical protein
MEKKKGADCIRAFFCFSLFTVIFFAEDFAYNNQKFKSQENSKEQPSFDLLR